MALTLTVALFGGVLEDADLLALAVLHHGSVHAGALHHGGAEGGAVAVEDSQDLVEGDLGVGLGLQLFDEEGVALGHLVLLSAGLNNCVHRISTPL